MATQDYLDFELNIEALDGTRLRVSVTNSPVGSVSVDVANPFTADEIAHLISVLDGSTGVTRSERAQITRAFGEKLFNTIFSGQIYAAYLASQERAGSQGLRIKLSLEDAGALEDIPWELLRDPRNDYLALSRQTPVIRYPRLLTVRPLVEISLPLRVLVMISSPRDQPALDVEAEWRALQDATKDLRSRGLLELERLDDAQLITLQRKLREGTIYHVFHYIGHAAFDDRSQTGLLAFEAPGTQTTVAVSGESLARELNEENSIRLVVLNACQGARENVKDPFAGIASSFVARGMPAVVAMQFAISDQASRVFSQEFYRALSEGYPIEAAMAESRRAISSTLDNAEWATPVLYLRAPTGILFPKRRAGDVSTGGLREVLRSPVGLIVGLLALLLCVGGVALVGSRLIPGSPTSTPAPTPDTRAIDLAVTSLRFFPPNPAPGERVTISMVLKNSGKDNSGPFKWAWYAAANPEDPVPSVQGTVANLPPGVPINVRGDYTFGWWDTYTTMAWVNFDNGVPETNISNNVAVRSVMTANAPFTVRFADLTELPDGSPLIESRDLKGTEFKPWNFEVAPDSGKKPACNTAIVKVNVRETGNRLITGLPGQPTACPDLPLVFTLAQAVGGASVEFIASGPGRYTLELEDANGQKIGQPGTVDVTTPNQDVTVRAPLSGNGLTNVQKIVFSGPDNSPVMVESVSYYLANMPVPTSTP